MKRRRGHALHRRYGRAAAGSGQVRSYIVSNGPLGPVALAYDVAGLPVTRITGSPHDHLNVLRRDARRLWPRAEERGL